MKGFCLKRNEGGGLNLYSGTHFCRSFCYQSFVKYFPHLKLKPDEKIPVNIKITRRKPERMAGEKE